MAGPTRIRYYNLSHTFVTILLSKETQPKIVQVQLRRANISQTMDTDSHVLPNMRVEAI